MTTIEIPADVRDNSETVTDYAYTRHHSPDKGVHTRETRDDRIDSVTRFPILGLTHYQWHDTSPDGQRCRFDMIVNKSGTVVNLFHTEYFTRVACAECPYSYASVYQALVTVATQDAPSEAVPRCDTHADRFRREVARTPGLVVRESERLLIGRHD